MNETPQSSSLWYFGGSDSIIEKLRQKSLSGYSGGATVQDTEDDENSKDLNLDLLSLGSERVDEEGYRYAIEYETLGLRQTDREIESEMKMVQKVYIPREHGGDSASYGVGWVVEDGILFCMICSGSSMRTPLPLHPTSSLLSPISISLSSQPYFSCPRNELQ